MGLKVSLIVITLSLMGLVNLFSRYQVDDSIKSAIVTYEGFLASPDDIDLEHVFLPIEAQVNLFNDLEPKSNHESMFLYLIDSDVNESLLDLKNDFAIDMSQCSTYYTKNIRQPEFTSFASNLGVSVILHQIECPDVALESLLFIKKDSDGAHKLYKSSFISKEVKNLAKN